MLGMRAPDNPIEADVWYADLDQHLSEDIETMNGVDKMKELQEYLRKLGSRYPHPDARWNAIFIRAQKATVSIPNHAKYLEDQINSCFDPVTKERVLSKGNEQRYLIRETLCYIPSPEMVWLLGEMLEDERGKIDDPKNRLGATSNADWACSALMLIGLENMPVPRGKGMMPVESAYLRKDTWKLWWGPIKAGNRSFSFAGQEVEYRFRNDGTYETISKNGVPKKSTIRYSNEPMQAEESKPRQRWLIFLSGCLVLLGWMWWVSAAKRLRKT